MRYYNNKQLTSPRTLLAAAVTLPMFTLIALAQPGNPRLKLQFNRDIRPILSDNCFLCHGMDAGKRMASLRLDDRNAAISKGAIVPGKPERSKLIMRILAKEDARRMPPPSSHHVLTTVQKNILKRWVAEGASYQQHWAFVLLPDRVAVPAVKNPGWCRETIDRFILTRLEQKKLRPSPEATKTDWLRRVSFDLIGLPPTLEELDAFLDDKTSSAYAKVVDRLLASPKFGERMAQPWLDVARYADSYGYQSDQLSPTWPFRDWVVKALNENLAYDKFIIWQLAGDLLTNPTREQRLATAFNRLHRMTAEGGSVPEEWRMEGVADRVQTLGMAVMGLSLGCARCHDHKYDPITQRDYYALSSYFNNIDEYGIYDQASIVPSPTLLLPNPNQENAQVTAKTALLTAQVQIDSLKQQRESNFRDWLKRPVPLELLDLTGRFDFDEFDGANVQNLAPGATKNGARTDEVKLLDGPVGKVIQLEGENNVHFPDLGRFDRYAPYTIAFWMRDARLEKAPVVVYQACDGTDAGPYGYDLLVENGVLTTRMFRHWPGNAIAVRLRGEIPKDTWTHVAVTYDGSSRAAGLNIYVNGKLADTEIFRDKMVKSIGQHTLVFGQRFRDRGFKGGQISALRIFNRNISAIEVAAVADERSRRNPLIGASEAALREYYFSAVDPAVRKAASELMVARQKYIASEDGQFEIAVMDEMPTVRQTYILDRGRYDAPQTEDRRVDRSTPTSLPPMPKWASKNRLGLAQWLVSLNHPLTARVAVNRFWSILFGRGLVETSEDFGVQGKTPSHPELLDWLARDFVNNGWDVKLLLKQIVLSSTYRQASAVRPELKDRDPQNILLARGPSQRLSAEAIRDMALQSAGLLDNRIGGPPVSPYQPGDLWRETNTMSPAYRQSVGGDLYRRSIYSVIKRTAPMQNLLAFDSTTRETCVARRQNTNTPLQALVLMNDTQFVEAARVIAERALKQSDGSSNEAIKRIYRQLTSKLLYTTELALLMKLHDDQHEQFKKDPGMAEKLLKIGASKPDSSLSPTDVAALTVVAQTILNLDSTIWKR